MKVDFRRILLCMVMIEKFRESNVFSKEKVLSRNIFQYLFFSTVNDVSKIFREISFYPFATCWFHVIFTLKRSRSPSSMTKCTVTEIDSHISTYHNMWFLEVNLIREEVEVVASL